MASVWQENCALWQNRPLSTRWPSLPCRPLPARTAFAGMRRAGADRHEVERRLHAILEEEGLLPLRPHESPGSLQGPCIN